MRSLRSDMAEISLTVSVGRIGTRSPGRLQAALRRAALAGMLAVLTVAPFRPPAHTDSTGGFSCTPEPGPRSEAAPPSTTSGYRPGTDITRQLRADLEAGKDVNLPAGRFFVSESVIVQGYAGTVQGGGMDSTIIQTSNGFRATPDPFFAPEFRFTEVMTVYGPSGDVNVRDLTILVRGDAPSAPHRNPWWPDATTIDNALSVVADRPDAEVGITVRFEGLRIAGGASESPGSARGHNLAYGIFVYGEGGNVPVNLVVRNCEFEHAGGAAIEFSDATGGQAEFLDLDIRKAHRGIVIGNGVRSAVVRDSEFDSIATAAIDVREGVSAHCFMGNMLDGAPLKDSGCR